MHNTATTVLVVDDDRIVRDFAKDVLERHGYLVQSAGDGESALTFLTSLPVDIVLIDIMMPRKEGLETIIELRQRYPKLTVFAMSSSGSRRGHDFLATAAKFGAHGVIQKPFTPEQLLKLLHSSPNLRDEHAPLSSLRA